MKKNVLLLVILMLFVMTGCASNGNAKKHIADHCKDPQSFRCYSIEHRSTDNIDVYKIVYDAKNSYGAYTGKDICYVYYDRDTKDWNCSECPGDFIAGALWEIAD